MHSLKKILLYLLLSIANIAQAQAQDTIPINTLGCDSFSPFISSVYDSTSFRMVGTDSIEVLRIKFFQMCPQAIGVYNIQNGIQEINIIDTATLVCTGDCHMKFSFKLPFPNDTLDLLLDNIPHQAIKSTLLNISNHSLLKKKNRIYPNPTKDLSQLDLGKIGTGLYQIINHRGLIIYEHSFENERLLQFNLNTYSTGIYFVKIIENKQLSYYRVIKY